jgi:hypothetical protein
MSPSHDNYVHCAIKMNNWMEDPFICKKVFDKPELIYAWYPERPSDKIPYDVIAIFDYLDWG